MKRSAISLGAIAIGLASSCGANAQDASFGCKVLLCAAASAPSWSSIPYCVPVMTSLFNQLAHDGSWPSCPEGNASGLGYQPYLSCPAGTTPMDSAGASGQGLVASVNGSLCADTSKPEQVCSGGGRGESCATTYPTIPRQPSSEPYFVDITTANGMQRFYFSLQGY